MKYNLINAEATFNYKKVPKSAYSEWHSQIVQAAGIVDNRYPVSGMRVWMPYGHKMMELLHNKFQIMIEAQGGQRMFYPIVIPYEFAKLNESWWEKFEVEGYHVCTKSKEKGLEGIGVMRPTGEPAMYPMYAMWIRSYSDLPLKSFQVCQNYRNESVTLPLLRPREFWWNEYHCAFATKEEVVEEAERHLQMIKDLAEFVAVPVITVKKPDWEVFPGGLMSYENYVVMPDGKTVDAGSINNLGQAYSRKFGIEFKDKDGGRDYAWVVCTGMGPRWLAGVLGFHGDDNGLVVPPAIAPIQVIIVPILKKGSSGELVYAKKVMKQLEVAGFRVDVDDRDMSPGRKFFDWEIKGVPLRIEVGSREVSDKKLTIVSRDNHSKQVIDYKDLKKKVNESLDSLQARIYKKASKDLKSKIKLIYDLKELMPLIKNGGVARMHWCEGRDCYDKIMAQGEGQGLDAFGTDPEPGKKGKCIVCGSETRTLLYAANTY